MTLVVTETSPKITFFNIINFFSDIPLFRRSIPGWRKGRLFTSRFQECRSLSRSHATRVHRMNWFGIHSWTRSWNRLRSSFMGIFHPLACGTPRELRSSRETTMTKTLRKYSLKLKEHEIHLIHVLSKGGYIKWGKGSSFSGLLLEFGRTIKVYYIKENYKYLHRVSSAILCCNTMDTRP